MCCDGGGCHANFYIWIEAEGVLLVVNVVNLCLVVCFLC